MDRVAEARLAVLMLTDSGRALKLPAETPMKLRSTISKPLGIEPASHHLRTGRGRGGITRRTAKSRTLAASMMLVRVPAS
jgi:hypothetical protein